MKVLNNTPYTTIPFKTHSVVKALHIGGESMMSTCSLVPRPPLFFVLWFAFSIIHGSRRAAKKRGSPGNTYHVNDVWWTRGGRRGGRGTHSNNVLEFIIECSNDSQDPRRSRDCQYSTLPPVRNLLYGLLYTSL